MTSKFDELRSKGLIKDYPRFLKSNVHYETIMGSVAYGVNEDASDFDVYGFAIPPNNILFPHLDGFIPGFGAQPPKFDQFQKHHLLDKDAEGGKGREYDLTIYNIVKYFDLCMGCNPNMVDSLFTPRRCVLHSTSIGELVRDNRKLFLSKLCWHKFKGYAYSQMHKMKSQTRMGKRAVMVEKYGYDLKFAYHIVRLMGEVHQILEEGDLDLERNREQLKSIRRGEWKIEEIEAHFQREEDGLEDLYKKSSLPNKPREAEIKDLLVYCLELALDGIDKAINIPDKTVRALQEVRSICDKALG